MLQFMLLLCNFSISFAAMKRRPGVNVLTKPESFTREGLPENRKMLQDTTRRHRPPQDTYSYKMPMCYCTVHTSIKSLWTKEKFYENTKLRPQKMRISIPSQTAVRRRKMPSCRMSTLLRLLNNQSMPSMDNKAATIIHGHCSVAVSPVDLEVTLLLGD